MCLTFECVAIIITYNPLVRGGAAYDYESPLGDSFLVMNIHNLLMHRVTCSNRVTP